MSKKIIKKTKVMKTEISLPIFTLENNVQSYIIDALELEGNVPLKDNYGKNLKYKSPDGEDLKSYIIKDKKGYREVTLEITSYLGSIGAVHYYGTLCSHSIHFTKVEDKTNRYSVGGYTTKNIPEKYDSFKIEVSRPVTQRDIDHDVHYGREDYMTSKIGDLTRGFWTEDDAIETGIAIFKLLFKGKWKLVINPYNDKKLPTVYSDK